MEILNLIEITVEVSVLVISIGIVRSLFAKKLNPNIRYFLWIFVAIRILIPFKMELPLELPEEWDNTPLYTLAENSQAPMKGNLMPKNPVIQNILGAASPVESEMWTSPADASIDLPANVSANLSSDASENASTDDTSQHTNFGITKARALYFVWLCGSLIMALYISVNNIRLHLTLKANRRKISMLQNRIPLYAVSGYNCLTGVLFPAVYVDMDHLNNSDVINDVIRHELQHYKVRDNYWQFLRVLCLILQWHNPFVWWAYFASRKDCELACDARAIKGMSSEERHNYGNSLLTIIECGYRVKHNLDFNTSMGTDKKFLSERIQAIMKNKYNKRIVLPSVIIGMIACICLISIHVYADTERNNNAQENVDDHTLPEYEKGLENTIIQNSEISYEDAENFLEKFSQNYPDFRVLDYVTGSDGNEPITLVAIVENLEDGTSSTLFIVTDNGVGHRVTLASDRFAAYRREDRLALRENVILISLDLTASDMNNEIHDFELAVTQEREQGEVINTLFSSKETIRTK